MTKALVCRRFDALLAAAAFVALSLTTVGGGASAHQGFGGRDDLARPVWIQGVVRQA